MREGDNIWRHLFIRWKYCQKVTNETCIFYLIVFNIENLSKRKSVRITNITSCWLLTLLQRLTSLCHAYITVLVWWCFQTSLKEVQVILCYCNLVKGCWSLVPCKMQRLLRTLDTWHFAQLHRLQVLQAVCFKLIWIEHNQGPLIKSHFKSYFGIINEMYQMISYYFVVSHIK